MKTTTRPLARLAALSVIVLGLIAAGCGADDEQSAGSGSATGNAADAAFVGDMTVHHEGAIEMARIAEQRAEHPEIKQLANDIIAAQESELATMKRIASDLPEQNAHGDGHSGMSDAEMGMDIDPAQLKTAKPFDRAFIDMMVPHHEGAVTMAQDLLENGEDPELQKMAEDIVDAQTKEIAQMREWRRAWYGSDDARGSDDAGHGEAHE